MRKPRRKPVSAEFRAACHAAIDALLDANPGTDSILIAFSRPGQIDAVSVPPGLPTKMGFIMALSELIPE